MEHDASQLPPTFFGSNPSLEPVEGPREKSLEELEELLRRVREDQRRLDESYVTPLRLSQQTSSTKEIPISDEPQWQTFEQDRAGDNWPLTAPQSPEPTTISAETSGQPPINTGPSDSAVLLGTSAENTMTIKELPQESKSYYGFVNPSILRGFGDDDESLWLVDDEETDSEGILTPLSESVDDLQKTLQKEQKTENSIKPNYVNRPSLEDILAHAHHTAKPNYINRPSLEDLLGAALPTAKPTNKREDEVRSWLSQNQFGRQMQRKTSQPSTSRFQYRQVPGLLDDFECQKTPAQEPNEAPPAYEALEASTVLQGLPDYSSLLEDVNDDPASRSQRAPERGMDTSETTDLWRHWGPLKREDSAIYGSRSDENNDTHLETDRGDLHTLSGPSTGNKEGKMAELRGLNR